MNRRGFFGSVLAFIAAPFVARGSTGTRQQVWWTPEECEQQQLFLAMARHDLAAGATLAPRNELSLVLEHQAAKAMEALVSMPLKFTRHRQLRARYLVDGSIGVSAVPVRWRWAEA